MNILNLDKRSKKKALLSYIQIILGVLIISISYYFILLPTKMVTGGMMGVSIILEDKINPVIFLYCSYIVLLVIGGIFLGKKFFLRSVFGTILQPTIILIFELCGLENDLFIKNFSNQNILLVAAISASILTGVGNGIMFLNNATTGGMDVVQKILIDRLKFPPSVALYSSDGIIILIGLFTFGLENTFFAVLSMYLCGSVLDYVIIGIKRKNACYIISEKHEFIKEVVFKELNRGVTETYVRGGYSLKEGLMLVCILSNREYIRLKEIVLKIDKEAFLFIVPANEVLGKGFSTDKISFFGTN